MGLSNPAFRLVLEDFYYRLNSWWEGDISTNEGINLESVSSPHRLITDPTYILPQTSSWIIIIIISLFIVDRIVKYW